MLFGQLVGITLIAAQSASVPDVRAMDSGLPLFADSHTLAVTIEGPLDALMRERSNEEYYEGVFRYSEPDGTEKALDLEFRTRGNYRRRKTTCRFPPVRLNFKKNQVDGTLFEGQNILKLVTHCRPGSDRYEEYVLREQLAYRILNLHTPASFRSRLLRITWVNTEDDNKEDIRYGFVIEHKNELEARLGMEEPGIDRTKYSSLNAPQAAIAAVFEYMIGNTDFSMIAAAEGEECCHNGILLKQGAGDLYFVPYDFDMAGLVDAPYAEPNPRFELRGVTERLYRGHCRFNDQLDDTVGLYRQNRDAVMALVDRQEGMDDRTRRRVTGFLEDFYDTIGSDSEVRDELMGECLGSD